MLYYDVQHHGDIEMLKWLAGTLQDKDNILNFSLDVDDSNFNAFSLWAGMSDIPNINVSRSFPVTWCGPSQITQMRGMLERAVEAEGWEYFINLSGSCFPLCSQSEIKKQILHEKKQNTTSFCFGFVPKKPSVWIERDNDPQYFDYKYNRLTVSCDKSIYDAFTTKSLDPVRNVMERRAIHCTEVVHEKHLVLRGLELWEIRERKLFWEKYKYHLGRAWMILHRKQVEWLLSTPLMNEFYCHLSNTFEPDETLFPSLLYSEDNPYLNELSKNNYRYKLGSPGILRESDMVDVFASQALFARKFPKNITAKALQFIESNFED